MQVRRLEAEDVSLIRAIDRSEHIDVQYAVVDGRLTERPVVMVEIPRWDAVGTGEHSVASHIEFCGPILAGGAALFGCFDGEDVMGLTVIDPTFERELAWLAWLHVSSAHRRRGAASALWA